MGGPESILSCAPSAELSDGQTDEGDLGFSYDAYGDWTLTGSSGSLETDGRIAQRWHISQCKREFPPAFNS